MKLLVVVVRALQARALGPYGNRWIETFSFNTLAAGGVVFDRHFSVHPDPVRTRQVWRTGRYCFSASAASASDHLTNVSTDLLALLHQQGVSTHLVLDTQHGEIDSYSAGWQRVERAPNARAALDLARAALESKSGSWLLWLDLSALIPPWQVPTPILEAYFSSSPLEEDPAYQDEDEETDPGEAEPPLPPLEPLLDPPMGRLDPDDDDLYLRLQETYGAAVSHLDALLGVLLDGLPDEVHALITSDAGLSLGEHGIVSVPPVSLHGEVVHIPLIVHGPGCLAGLHVDALTGTIDLAPTLAEWAGTKLPSAHGHSLVPWLSGGKGPARENIFLETRIGETLLLGLRSSAWSFLCSDPPGHSPPQLFVQPDDAWEVNDVCQHHLHEADALERTLREVLQHGLDASAQGSSEQSGQDPVLPVEDPARLA